MKISVQNLGAIKEGSISLDKSLTVLVGPNNSGKSYIAYLVYGFLKDKGKMGIFPFNFIQEKELKKDDEGWYIDNIKEVLSRSLDKIKDYLVEHINTSVVKYFSSNKINPTIDLTVSSLKEKINNYPENEDAIMGIPAISAFRKEIKDGDDDVITDGKFLKIISKSGARLFLLSFLLRMIFEKIAKDALQPNIYFFPTERLALSMLSNDEVGRKSRQADELGKLLLEGNLDEKLLKILQQEKDKFKPTYPQAINDYIYFINDLRDTVKRKGDFEEFADEIQQMLMEGNVSVSSFGDINYTPKDSDAPIEIHISSSLVKSLSGLVLYFRHLAKEGDTIIIDEPEVNLHPNNQRIIARVIAKAINKGFKIILSTHSDYIIKELNNLVMLSKANENPALKEELLKDLASNGYDKDCYLNKEDLGVYFFDENTIEDLEVDDMGFDVATIDTELDKLNYASEHIYYSLFEKTT